MIFNLVSILSSGLIASVISRILAKQLVFEAGLNIFPDSGMSGIQLLSPQFALGKSYDLVEYILFILLSLIIFGLIYYLFIKNDKKSQSQNLFIGLSLFCISSVYNISTLFARSSGSETIISIFILIFLTYVSSSRLPEKIPTWNNAKVPLTNGIIAGFFLYLLLHNITPAIAFPISIFILVPLCFYFYSEKILF